MPYEYSIKLRNNRNEKPDQHEMSVEHLKHAEIAYLELEKIYAFERINCVSNGIIRTPDEISEEVINLCEEKMTLKNIQRMTRF